MEARTRTIQAVWLFAVAGTKKAGTIWTGLPFITICVGYLDDTDAVDSSFEIAFVTNTVRLRISFSITASFLRYSACFSFFSSSDSSDCEDSSDNPESSSSFSDSCFLFSTSFSFDFFLSFFLLSFLVLFSFFCFFFSGEIDSPDTWLNKIK